MAIAGIVYLALFVLSAVFALISFLLGGDHDVDHDVGDLGDHVPSFLSPRVISLFILGFSGMGLIAHYAWDMAPTRSSLIGLGGGIVLGGIAYGLIVVLHREQSTSAPVESDYAGLTGRTTIAIPKGGTGEVSVVVKGQLRSVMASAADGKPIAEGRPVKIIRIAAGVASVEEAKS